MTLYVLLNWLFATSFVFYYLEKVAREAPEAKAANIVKCKSENLKIIASTYNRRVR